VRSAVSDTAGAASINWSATRSCAFCASSFLRARDTRTVAPVPASAKAAAPAMARHVVLPSVTCCKTNTPATATNPNTSSSHHRAVRRRGRATGVMPAGYGSFTTH